MHLSNIWHLFLCSLNITCRPGGCRSALSNLRHVCRWGGETETARVSSSSYITKRCKLDPSDFLEALFSAFSTSPFSHLYWRPHFLSNDVPRCYIWKIAVPNIMDTSIEVFIHSVPPTYPGLPWGRLPREVSRYRCLSHLGWVLLMWRSSSSIPSSSQMAEVLTPSLWECPATLSMTFCAFSGDPKFMTIHEGVGR